MAQKKSTLKIHALLGVMHKFKMKIFFLFMATVMTSSWPILLFNNQSKKLDFSMSLLNSLSKVTSLVS